ncbi:MAG: T9SS C-terminal target domain-containing protein, partial [Candidatus Neomarinimicrobiota bacterium]
DLLLATADNDVNIPNTFTLYQNYPNPFNPTTTLRYDVPEDGLVQIVVFDLMGREVTELVNRQVPAGRYKAIWDGRNAEGAEVPAGMYFARMTAGEYSKVIKMVLMK